MTMHGFDRDSTDSSYCFVHNEAEPIPKNVYIVCFECGHVWTKRSLLKVHRKIVRQLRGRWAWLTQSRLYWRRADNIFFCQECCHDF